MKKNAQGRDPFLDELFGDHSQAEIARTVSKPGKTVTRHAVNQWKKVPDQHVQAVADMGYPLKKVRRDLYDPEFRKAMATAPAPDSQTAAPLG